VAGLFLEGHHMKTIIRFLAAALLCTAAQPAFAASKLYISEYNALGVTSTAGAVAQVAQEPAITDQAPVDYSGGVASSATFNANTNLVRVLCTSTCSIKIVTSGNATTSNKPLGAGAPEYFAVPQTGTYKISVIANTDF
jgi:hypothetical protein